MRSNSRPMLVLLLCAHPGSRRDIPRQLTGLGLLRLAEQVRLHPQPDGRPDRISGQAGRLPLARLPRQQVHEGIEHLGLDEERRHHLHPCGRHRGLLGAGPVPQRNQGLTHRLLGRPLDPAADLLPRQRLAAGTHINTIPADLRLVAGQGHAESLLPGTRSWARRSTGAVPTTARASSSPRRRPAQAASSRCTSASRTAGTAC